MKPVVIQFRDKKDIRPLPKIPSKFNADMQELLKTKINRSDLSHFQKLEAIYAFTDSFSTFVATFAVCQKGCNHCCKIDVSVSRIEAEYIARAYPKGPKLDLNKSKTQNHKTACPFLGESGSCTVYNVRPFNCRTFHTLDDPKYCADGDVTHQVYGAAGMGYRVGFYQVIATWLKNVNDTSGLPYRDIRDWFPSKPSLMNRLISRFKG